MCKVVDKEMDLISLEDAAEQLSSTGLRLLMLIREGNLEGHEVEGKWYISLDSLERLKGTGGTPPIQQKDCASGCTASKCGCH